MAFCSVCAVKYEKGSELSLHSFPKNPDIRKKWNVALHCEDFILPRNCRVCSNHFTPESFDFNAWSSKKTLKKDAVPTIFKFSDNLPPSAILKHAKRKPVLETPSNEGLSERVPPSSSTFDQCNERSTSKARGIERMVMSAPDFKYQLLIRKVLKKKNHQIKILKQYKRIMERRLSNYKNLFERFKSTQSSLPTSLESRPAEDVDNVKSKSKFDNSPEEESLSDLKACSSIQRPEKCSSSQPLTETTITNELLLSFIEHLKKPPVQDDRYDIIGKSVAVKLRNLPKKKMFVTERKINDILFEAEVGSVNRGGVSETMHQQEASSSAANFGNTSTIPILTAFGLLVNPPPSTTSQQESCSPSGTPNNNFGQTIPNVNVYSRTITSSKKSAPSPTVSSEDVQYNVHCKEEPYY